MLELDRWQIVQGSQQFECVDYCSLYWRHADEDPRDGTPDIDMLPGITVDTRLGEAYADLDFTNPFTLFYNGMHLVDFP